MKKKILIVDDSESARMKMKTVLGDNYITVEAIHGNDALRILEGDKEFDLIIMDINMPELNGMEFIKFQSTTEEIKNIPTMMCTTEASQQMKQKAREYGVVKAWFIKPIIEKLFLKAINHVLKK